MGGGAGKDNMSDKQQEAERPGGSRCTLFCVWVCVCVLLANIITIWMLKSDEGLNATGK